MKYDLAIIGGGIAGVMAALRARELKKNVVIISRGWGATAMSSGALDFWDLSQTKVTADQFRKNIAENQHHPYHVLGLDGNGFSWDKLQSIGEAAMVLLRPAMEKAGLLYHGGLQENIVLMTEHGLPQPTNFAQESQFAGNSATTPRKALIIGFKGLKSDYHPVFLASAMKYWSEKGFWPKWEVETIEIDLASFGGNAGGYEPLETAQFCDNSIIATELQDKLKITAKKFDASLIILPPVMGIKKASDYVKELKEEGIGMAEVLAGGPPSTPGHRLQATLDRLIRLFELPYFRGEVTKVESSKKNITGLTCRMGQREERIEADEFILATGKFAGGGLFAQGGFRETLLQLPVFHNGKEVTCSPEFPLVDPKFSRRQDILSLGLAVDQHLRPLGENCRLVWDNLKACGGVLGGAYPFEERCGMGLAIISGYAAVNK